MIERKRHYMKIIDTDVNGFLERIQNHENNEEYGCICWGSGNTLFNEVDKRIIPYMNHIVDTDPTKVGNKVEINSLHFTVESVDIFDTINWKNNCLLITTNFFYEVVKYMKKYDNDDLEVYIYPTFKYYNISHEEMYRKRVTELAVEYEYVKSKFDSKAAIKTYRRMNHYCNGNEFIVPKLVFLLTTRCSLRCKECTGLIPRLNNPPIDFPLENVKRDIDRVLEVVKEINILQLAGGESLLYPQINEILEYTLNKDEVKTVHFVTNGTIIPSEETLKLLRNPKILIYISDYGFKEKLDKLTKILDDNNVNYKVLTEMEWIKVGNSEKRNKDYHQKKWEYMHCPNGRGCKIIFDGKIFPCDRSGRMYLESLYIKPDYEHYDAKNDLVEMYNCSDEALLEKIKGIYLTDYIEACDYCDMANISVPKIEPAEQI